MVSPIEASEARRLAARRAVDPAVTLERVRPLFRPMGITRVANITGLDRIGLPVVNVVRPNARFNSVFQGKGLDLVSAKVSGIMEAIESCCAEHVMKPLLLASETELARSHRLVEVKDLAIPRGSIYAETTPLLWIEGKHAVTLEPRWVPYELVHMNFTVPPPPGSGLFLLSSNGLASGNTREEAIAHALCEVIERDAGALFDAAPAAWERRRIALGSINDPGCRAALARLENAGMAVALWDLTSNIGVAAVRCQIIERLKAPGAMPLPALGEGCHPERSVALARAITEAAQGRLSVIAGVRDDIGPDMYTRFDDPRALEQWRNNLLSSRGGRQFDAIPDHQTSSTRDEVNYLISCLYSAGLDDVIVVDLGPADCADIAVVRVIVPGLEPPSEANCLPGRRLQASAAP